MARLFLIGQVGVFRQCRECGQWRKTGSYSGRGTRRCGQCYKHEVSDRRGHRGAMTRTIVLTDLGRAALAELRAAS